MLPWWTKTERGFWVDPSHARLTVADLADLAWTLSATCASCGRGRTWDVAEAGEAFRPGVRVGAIALRLVCTGCGSDQGRVAFTQDLAVTKARDLARSVAKWAEEQARRR